LYLYILVVRRVSK